MYEHTSHRFSWLTQQIEAGWHVEAPVFERPTWRGTDDVSSRFEFVLRGEQGCQVIAVDDCPEVRAFLKESGFDSISL